MTRRRTYSLTLQEARRIRAESGLPIKLARAIDALGVPVLAGPKQKSEKSELTTRVEVEFDEDGQPNF